MELMPDTNFTSPINGTDDKFMNYSTALTAVFITAYVTVFVLGVFGNIFVILVIGTFEKMRTITNIFVFNLACADLLVIIFCLPATLLANIFVPWILGWHLCKLVPFFQGVSVSASVYTLVAIAFEKFQSIVYPLKLKMTSRKAIVIILLIWLYSLLITAPWLLYFELKPVDPAIPDILICTDIWPLQVSGDYYFLIANFGLTYFLPLCLISVFHVAMYIKLAKRNIPGQSEDSSLRSKMEKSKLKMEKMLIVVVFIFMLSWLPLYVVFSLIKFGKPEKGSFEENTLNVLIPIAQWMGTCNSCMNPMIYAYNRAFRVRLLSILKCTRMQNRNR